MLDCHFWKLKLRSTQMAMWTDSQMYMGFERIY